MWIPESDLIIRLELSPATVWRWRKAGKLRWRYGKRTGSSGKTPIEIELESLPSDLQFKWHQLHNQKRASATASTSEPLSQGPVSDEEPEGLTEHESNQPPVDERLEKFAAALARFCAPEYTAEQREAVSKHALRMAKICNQVEEFGRKGPKGRKLTVKSPGSREAGKDRAYHPELKQLARQTACNDAIYSEMYPSSKKALTPATLLQLTKKYRKEGLVTFIRERQTLRPALDERFLEVPPQAIDWLRERFESYSSAAISRFGKAWLEAMRHRGIKLPFSDWRPGAPGSCYAWLYRWYRKIPQTAFILATEGKLGLEAKVDYIIRNYEDVKPREIWTMDWKQLDVCYWLPAARPGDAPRLVREWLCPTLDVASRAPFGFQIQDRPNARGITDAYLDAVMMTDWKKDSLEPGLALLCGMQRAAEGSQPSLHLDNGKDFRAFAIDGKETKVRRFEVESGLKAAIGSQGISLSADFDLKIRNAKVRNAKAKIVEPWFRYAIGLWEETQPGYCGNRPENKPHWFAAALRLHRAFTQRRNGKPADVRELPALWRETFDQNEAEFGVGTPFLKREEFHKRFILRLREYLRSPHESLRDAIGDLSPLGYLEANADSPHMLSEQAAYALLMAPRIATVKNGEIVLNVYGERLVYRAIASDLSDERALHRLPTKETVEVRVNRNNLGRVLVMGSGAAICWAENPEVQGWGASEANFREAHAKKKRRDEEAMKGLQAQFQPNSDWRSEVEGRENVIAMPVAVNENRASQLIKESEGSNPWGESLDEERRRRNGGVAVITRFDRKDGTGTKGKSPRKSKREGLKIVHAIDDSYSEFIDDELLEETEAPTAAVPFDDGLSDFID